MRPLPAEQGRGQAGTGGVAFTVTWPTPASLIPRSWRRGQTWDTSFSWTKEQLCAMLIWWMSLNVVLRYPVILEHFSLRPGSGGAGKYCGGDGVVRKLLFRNQVVLSVLTERRSTRPYGLMGKLWGLFRGGGWSNSCLLVVSLSFLFCLVIY